MDLGRRLSLPHSCFFSLKVKAIIIYWSIDKGVDELSHKLSISCLTICRRVVSKNVSTNSSIDDLSSVVTEMHFLLQKKLKNIMHGRVKMYVMR